MINQKNLLALGFKLTGEHRRYNTYTKDATVVTVNRFKVGGEYLSSVTIDGLQREVKTIEKLKELLT